MDPPQGIRVLPHAATYCALSQVSYAGGVRLSRGRIRRLSPGTAGRNLSSAPPGANLLSSEGFAPSDSPPSRYALPWTRRSLGERGATRSLGRRFGASLRPSTGSGRPEPVEGHACRLKKGPRAANIRHSRGPRPQHTEQCCRPLPIHRQLPGRLRHRIHDDLRRSERTPSQSPPSLIKRYCSLKSFLSTGPPRSLGSPRFP